MNEIKVAENKTLKLTNVVARRIAPEELGNMMVALTQLQNFIKSHNAQPIGPLVQALKIGPAPEHAPELYLMQQATQLITQTEPGYEVDAVLRVKNCLYAHYTGPMAYSRWQAPSCRSSPLKRTSSSPVTTTPFLSARTTMTPWLTCLWRPSNYDNDHPEPR